MGCGCGKSGQAQKERLARNRAAAEKRKAAHKNPKTYWHGKEAK